MCFLTFNFLFPLVCVFTIHVQKTKYFNCHQYKEGSKKKNVLYNIFIIVNVNQMKSLMQCDTICVIMILVIFIDFDLYSCQIRHIILKIMILYDNYKFR